jgi:hypothetical protein
MNRFSLGALAARLRRWRSHASAAPSRLPPLPRGTAERFTFTTSAYDTRPEFLHELAATIAAQDAEGASWVLVDNGSTNGPTRDCLDELARRPGVQLVRVDENRGILGGMRTALEAATTDFVIPVDSDDLLAPHTITALGHTLLADPAARFLFSDEDHFTDGKRCTPFYRTGWDPALAMACSYVWHLCAFDRREALRLQVYADPGANYCHDWDTLLRFVRAGHRPRHVREILYSWRTHASSTTNNSAEAHQGSLASQRHVLDLHLRETGLADRFVVADCPIWRGAPELRLERTATNVPAIDLVVVANDATAPAQLERIAAHVAASAPIRRRLLWGHEGAATPGGWTTLRGEAATVLAQLAHDPAFAVLLHDANATVKEPDAARELIGWLELLSDVVLVGGRLLGPDGRVVSAGYWPSPRGGLAAPDRGRAADDAGYLAMALKPRAVAAPPSGCVLVRGSWLGLASKELTGQAIGHDTLAAWLGITAAATGMRCVCTPFTTVTLARGEAAIPETLHTSVSAPFTDFAPQGVWYGALGKP